MRSINVKALVLSAVFVACLFGALPPAAFAQEDPPPAPTPTPTPACTVDTDKDGYLAGEVVTILGSGFGPLEEVTLQVTHADGTAEPGMGHESWVVATDASGAFTSTWQIQPLEQAGHEFKVTAAGGAE